MILDSILNKLKGNVIGNGLSKLSIFADKTYQRNCPNLYHNNCQGLCA